MALDVVVLIVIIVVMALQTQNFLAGTTSISAMDLRSNPGTILDKVDYKQESFIVERAGKPKAVLIPINNYGQYLDLKGQAKERFFDMTDDLRNAFSKEKPEVVQKEIQKAIKETRLDDTFSNS